MTRKLKNKDGYILATTLIVMIILTIFGLALVNLSSADSFQSKHYEKSLQAKYVAKSGADIMAEYIIKNTADFELKYKEYIEEDKNFPFEMKLNEDKAIVDVERTDDGVTIISEGVFKENRKKIKLFLKNIAIGNEPVFHIPIEIGNLSGGRYNNLGSNSVIDTIKDKNDITASKYNLTVIKDTNTTIDFNDGNKEYGNIDVEEGGALILNTRGEDRILIVNDFNIKGYLALSQDGGRIFLIVKGTATFNNSYKDSENQLIILGMDGSIIKLVPTSDKVSYLYIYSPYGTTEIGEGVVINGAIIVSGNSESKISDKKNIRYRPLDKGIKLDGYTFYEPSYIYKLDRYDNSF